MPAASPDLALLRADVAAKEASAAAAVASVERVAATEVHGEFADRFRELALGLAGRLDAHRREREALEAGERGRGAGQAVAAWMLLAIRLEQLLGDAGRLGAAAPLLGIGPAAAAAWQRQCADLLRAPELLHPLIDQAVRLAAQRVGALAAGERLPDTEDVPEHARALRGLLGDGRQRTGRALEVALEALERAQPAPGGALEMLAQQQERLSDAVDESLDDVFLPALGLHHNLKARPGIFSRAARAAWERQRTARNAALLAFDEDNARHEALAAAAEFLDPEAGAGGSLDPVGPAALAAWWSRLSEPGTPPRL
ncbi:MAG: hypothetical protein LBE25_05200 [Arthrobacter sp.]|jgi:hypothetical protein|nr:hypothetical protein [Arthrobacter sp.]